MGVKKLLLFCALAAAKNLNKKCYREIVVRDAEELFIPRDDFRNELCTLRFSTDDSDNIELKVDDVFCSNQFHFIFTGAVAPTPLEHDCANNVVYSAANTLEVTLTLRKASLNLSQEGLRLSVSKQRPSSELLVADISDAPVSSYQKYGRDKKNDTKADDGYIDWAVYVVVLVLIVLPIVAVLYCACKSTMPTSGIGTTNNGQRTNETRLNQTAKTISQQPMNP